MRVRFPSIPETHREISYRSRPYRRSSVRRGYGSRRGPAEEGATSAKLGEAWTDRQTKIRSLLHPIRLQVADRRAAKADCGAPGQREDGAIHDPDRRSAGALERDSAREGRRHQAGEVWQADRKTR